MLQLQEPSASILLANGMKVKMATYQPAVVHRFLQSLLAVSVGGPVSKPTRSLDPGAQAAVEASAVYWWALLKRQVASPGQVHGGGGHRLTPARSGYLGVCGAGGRLIYKAAGADCGHARGGGGW